MTHQDAEEFGHAPNEPHDPQGRPVKSNLTSKQTYAMRKQGEFIEPVKIAQKLGYEWDLTITGVSSFYKYNKNGDKIYKGIKEIIQESDNE